MAAEAALVKLCAAAGPRADEALTILNKLLGNVVDHPAEPKFRRVNAESAKLRQALLCHQGADEFLAAAGFVRSADNHLEVPQSALAALIDARSAVIRQSESLQRRREVEQTSAGASQVAADYRAAVAGGAKGAGSAELQALKQQPGGPEVLQLLEGIIRKIRMYPDTAKFRCLNLAKPAGKKVLPAAPLLQLAGFQQGKTDAGEDCLQLARPNPDVLERVWAMVWWAIQPPFVLEPRPAEGPMERALGALLGAAIGDALGAPLGGKGPMDVSAQELDKVLEMCGGGVWGVAPGQTTGNTDLAVCLASCLAAAQDPIKAFPMEAVALEYGKWGRSLPFRGDRACLQAFQRPLPADDMAQHALDQNQKATGCGALARCGPLAALAVARNSVAACTSWAREEAKLSHPSASLGFANATYIVAAATLIKGGGNHAEAVAEVQRWVSEEHEKAKSGAAKATAGGGQSGWTHLSKGAQEPVGKRTEQVAWAPPGEQLVAVEEVAGWIKKALSGKGDLPFSNSSAQALLSGEVGSAEIPFMHAFRHLHSGSSFEAAMRAVLAGGGDSSSNATIVGGLLGAAVGLQGIPPQWLQAVMTSDPSGADARGQARPPEYHPKLFPVLVQRLFGPGAKA